MRRFFIAQSKTENLNYQLALWGVNYQFSIMKIISLRAQLNGYLYQAERQIVNSIIRRVASQEDRDSIRLILLIQARFKGKVNVKSDDHYVALLTAALLPYIKMSEKKAQDTNYNIAIPADLPIADDCD